MLEQKIETMLGSQKLVRTSPDSSITQAAKIMAEAHVGAILVGTVDDVSGIFTERDMLERVIIPGLAPETTRLSDVLSDDPVFVRVGDSMLTAMTHMKEQGSRYVLVTRADQVVGIISVVDVLRAVLGAGVEEPHKFDHLWGGIPI